MTLRRSPLTLGSLFSGIGGLEIGLERAGMQTVWQVERDEYCRKVLAKHWPDVKRYEDVRVVGAHNLERVDVICGGFPCQDISAAGKKEGITGERSGLWTHFHRVVRELRPRFVVVENVGDLLVRGFDVVLGMLAEIGYDAEWEVLPAYSVGAPHRRERVFIVAYPEELHCDGRNNHGRRCSKCAKSVSESRNGGRTQALADTERRRLQGGVFGRAQPPADLFAPLSRDRFGYTFGSSWEPEPAVGLLADGVPDLVDRLRALGNAVVPQVAQYVGECIVAHAKAMERAA